MTPKDRRIQRKLKILKHAKQTGYVGHKGLEVGFSDRQDDELLHPSS